MILRAGAHAFCTMVDIGYLPRLLVMQRSLARQAPGIPLYVLCMDGSVRRTLEHLALPDVVLVDVETLEAERSELRVARRERTLPEYCWTVKPALCRHLLERLAHVEMLAYADADLAFFADPIQLFERFPAWSALIVPHGWDRVDWARTHGEFNAGFVAFRRGAEAEAILEWWGDRCLEWCFARVEDGRFADQKYLETWSDRFGGVHVLDEPAAGLAPWNASLHRLERDSDGVLVDGARLIVFHFQSLKLYRGFTLPRLLGLASHRYRLFRSARLVWAVDRSYPVATDAERLVYQPYLRAVLEAVDDVAALNVPVTPSYVRLGAREGLTEAARPLLRIGRSGFRRLRELYGAMPQRRPRGPEGADHG